MQAQSEDLIQKIASLSSPEQRYAFLMELGRGLPPFPKEFLSPEWIVPGCQSILYLKPRFENGKLFFDAHCDALISAGLAALLIGVYNGKSPLEILQTPPLFLQELGISASLSPNRSLGLQAIYQRMQRYALQALANK
jgi:cysteine desulfuration protein SufE